MQKWCVLIVSAVAGASAANAATVNPVADAFVTTGPTSNLTTNNYGAAGALTVAAAGLPKGEARCYLRFDLSAIKASFDSTFGAGNWVLSAATLTLGATTPNNTLFNGNGAGAGGTNVNLAGAFNLAWINDDSWGEGTGNPNTPATNGITWDNQPTTTGESVGASLAFAGATSGTSNYALTPSAGFKSDLAAGSLLSLRMSAADSGVAYTFNSRTGTSAPVLTLIAAEIPEPGSSSLIALTSLATLARRRK